MNKALIIIKSPGIGDLQIMLSNIHHISKEIDKPVTILAQKNTRAKAVFKHDPHHVDEILNLEKKDFFNIINKIKPKKFGQAYIYSDSIRLYLIAKLSNISKIFIFVFFSIIKSVSKNFKFNFFAKSLPIVDFPEAIMPTNIRFLFNFISISIEKTQICLNLKLFNGICNLKKKQELAAQAL